MLNETEFKDVSKLQRIIFSFLKTKINSMMHVNRVKPHRVGRIVAIRSSVSEEHTNLINRDRLYLLPASNTYQQLVQF